MRTGPVASHNFIADLRPERKQQIMQSVRSEIALSNAQELITVRTHPFGGRTDSDSVAYLDDQRQMLRKMYLETFDVTV